MAVAASTMMPGIPPTPCVGIRDEGKADYSLIRMQTIHSMRYNVQQTSNA